MYKCNILICYDTIKLVFFLECRGMDRMLCIILYNIQQ